jgi:hippurate hydrolase
MSVFKQKLTDLRHDLHRNPELGFNEDRTKTIVADYLRKLGLDVYEGTGVVGVLKAGKGNRAIGLRADMDALPIEEKNTHDYVSANPGIMHACGHDGHTAMLLGAAELLTKSQDFDGTVVFIFQPNEELGLGALAMIDEGLMEQHPIEEIYAIHNLPGAPVGQISTRIGQICASESLFEIRITGKGGHASMPHVGVDPIPVGAEMVLALQTIIARKMAPSSGAVISVTEFLTDGQRNVLPGQVILKGDVRARHPDDRKALETFMRQIVSGVATAHGITASMTFNTEFIEAINAEEPTQAVIRTSKSLGLDTVENCPPMSFSEDFAHLSDAVPGCFLLLGNGVDGACGQPLHSSDYDFNDALLPIGAEFWASLAKDRLPVQQS